MKFEIGQLVLKKETLGNTGLVIDLFPLTVQFINKGKYINFEFEECELISLEDYMIFFLEKKNKRKK